MPGIAGADLKNTSYCKGSELEENYRRSHGRAYQERMKRQMKETAVSQAFAWSAPVALGILDDKKPRPGAMLHELQETFGDPDGEAEAPRAEILNVSRAEVDGIAKC